MQRRSRTASLTELLVIAQLCVVANLRSYCRPALLSEPCNALEAHETLRHSGYDISKSEERPKCLQREIAEEHRSHRIRLQHMSDIVIGRTWPDQARVGLSSSDTKRSSRDPDIAFDAHAVVTGFAPAIFVSIAFTVDTKDSTIYSFVREGYREFSELRKIRFMITNSDKPENHSTDEQLNQRREERMANDDSCSSKLGSLLKSISVDEFPRFTNAFLCQLYISRPQCITEECLCLLGRSRILLQSASSDIENLGKSILAIWLRGESGLSLEPGLGYIKDGSLEPIVKTFSTMNAAFTRTDR